MIYNDKKTIAQANLDNVILTANRKEQQFKILKLRMIDQKQEKHLNALIAALQVKWPLEPQVLTKFEHILAMERKQTK